MVVKRKRTGDTVRKFQVKTGRWSEDEVEAIKTGEQVFRTKGAIYEKRRREGIAEKIPRWTEQEMEALLKMRIQDKAKYSEISEKLGRSELSCRVKYCNIGRN